MIYPAKALNILDVICSVMDHGVAVVTLFSMNGGTKESYLVELILFQNISESNKPCQTAQRMTCFQRQVSARPCASLRFSDSILFWIPTRRLPTSCRQISCSEPLPPGGCTPKGTPRTIEISVPCGNLQHTSAFTVFWPRTYLCQQCE